MKNRYLFASIVAIAAIVAGCSKGLPGNLDELEVSKSYVSIPEAGGTDEITVTAKDNWTVDIDAKASWLTVSPMSGGAGETVLKFSAESTINTNQTTVRLKIGDKLQYINVKQQVGSGDPVKITCAEVSSQPDGKEVMVEGMCVKITESQKYGNWYLRDDTGEIYIYGTQDNAIKGIDVGDVVLVQGPKADYKGTIELIDAKVLKITKSILKLDKDMVKLDKEEQTFTVKAEFSGKVLEPSIDADWLTVVGASAADGSITYNFKASAFEQIAAPRTATITFTAKKKISDKEEQTSVVAVSVKQAGKEPALSTISDALAVPGSDVHIEGTIVANCTRGYVVSDATGNIFVYSNKFNSKIKIGEKRKVVGKISAYNYGPQIGTLYFDEWIAKGKATYPTPVVLDAAEMKKIVKSLGADEGTTAKISVDYVKVTGTVKAGKYINIIVDGESTLQVSPYSLTDKDKTALTELNGKKIDLYGYFTSISRKQFFNIVVTKFAEVK